VVWIAAINIADFINHATVTRNNCKEFLFFQAKGFIRYYYSQAMAIKSHKGLFFFRELKTDITL
jgi:hypothetical protein